MLMIMSALTLSSCSKDDSKELEPETDIVGVWRWDFDNGYELLTFEENGRFSLIEYDFNEGDGVEWSEDGRYMVSGNRLTFKYSSGETDRFIIHSLTKKHLIFYYEGDEFGVSGFFRCMAIFQANSLHSLNMKKRGSDTPLNWVRNILILALKDSAEAFVARDLK